MERLRQMAFIKRCSEWLLNIILTILALVALWLLCLVFIYSTFTIPTESMMPALNPKDRVVVWKMEAGARIFSLRDAFQHKPLKIFRVPSISTIARNDIVIFNYPYPERWDSIGFDVKLYYAKRCVALPGDSFEIRHGVFQVRNYKGSLGYLPKQREIGDKFSFTNDQAVLRKIKGYESYPYDSTLLWNIVDFGPLYLPKAGDHINLSRKHYVLYKNLIAWETRSAVRMQGDTVFIDDRHTEYYTFTHNYYFVAGDNCTNSSDSRYWGLLPDDYIVGKAHKIDL